MISKYVKDEPSPSTNPSGKNESGEDLLPVSLLCGFLGAGKTTLLKHVLETKHSEDGFRCAVIVNDMATLNIDKSLIDQSALVQTDEVIAMQNGCFCCTLQNDLVEQIKELAAKKMFNYMLIEASGVSEPSQIAPLFELCEDEHDPDNPDPDHEHSEGPELGEVARLDTCITVVDAAEFYNNLDSMRLYEEGEIQGTIAELMTEQVEFSNVVIMNKQDMVSEEQQLDILDRIHLLNPKAKVLKSKQSKVDVKEILNTNLYSRSDMEENSIMISATKADSVETEKEEECCVISVEKGKKKCCKSKTKKDNTIDSGLSQVLIGVVPLNSFKAAKTTRHESRFGISSFVYRSRRPFHPDRLYDNFLEPYFMLPYEEKDDGPQLRSYLEKQQKIAVTKKKNRVEHMGELLRSKGFVWVASSNKIMGGWQQAGNVIRMEGEGLWMCENPALWKGTGTEELVLKDMRKESGEDWPFGDRRQELVFIGIKLSIDAIQNTLDSCLLTDEEMELGPEKWEETMGDSIKLFLEEDAEEFEDSEGSDDDDEEGEDNEDNEDQDEKEVEEKVMSIRVQVGKKRGKENKKKKDDDEEEVQSPSKKSKSSPVKNGETKNDDEEEVQSPLKKSKSSPVKNGKTKK